jgi:hypothetical protein
MAELLTGDAFVAAVEKLIEEESDLERLRRVARILHGETSFLCEHDPRGDDQFGKYPCTRAGHYHSCSFGANHHPRCKAVGGDGDVPSKSGHARSCEPDCAEGLPEPWCNCSGFDCPDCAVVAELNAILAEAVPA